VSTAGKAELRKQFAARRRALSSGQIVLARSSVRRAVLGQVRAAGWRRVAAYEPLPTEPGSVELLSSLGEDGVDVLVPLVLPDRDLDWVRWGEHASPLGVDAVAEVDALLVPALAVALDGTRLGRGGGSYDRALARVAGRPVAALLFLGELVDELPADPWDRPVTAVAMPSGWRELT